MATKKPKSSTKSAKTKSVKPKTAAKTTVTEPVVSEAPKTKTVEKTEKVTTPEKPAEATTLKGFFSKKYEGDESILTIFKKPRFYGALLGEVVGTMLLSLLLFSMSLIGVHNLATYAFAFLAILIAIYAFSGAVLNPLLAAGLMASRRISVIRGVMYIVAEIIGAWLAWLIFNGFHAAGGEAALAALPAMSEIAEDGFAAVALIELIGGAIIAFVFTRALKYKRSVFTFGATVAGGIVLAAIVAYVISAGFAGLSNNFVLNPATALMYQIFPTAGESFGEIMGGVCQALAAYCVFPMVGGVIGFYLSDFIARLSGQEE